MDIDEGNDYKKISAYNGGLFEEDLDFIKIRDIVDAEKLFNNNLKSFIEAEFDKRKVNIASRKIKRAQLDLPTERPE